MIAGFIFAVLGAIDAGYLASLALRGDPLTCNFIEGCEVVAMSPYSRVMGIPLSLFGFFFYTVSAFALIGEYLRPTVLGARLLVAVSSLGLLASLYFAYLQAFVIRAWCEYCIFSGFMALLVFIVAIVYTQMKPKELS